MNKYCKGKLFDLKNIDNLEVNIDVCNKLLLTSDPIVIDFIKNIYKDANLQEKKILSTYINNGSLRYEVFKIFCKYANKINYNIPPIIDIVFEILRDKNNNFYGRELITNRIFPIINKNINMESRKLYEKTFYFPIDNSKEILMTFDNSRPMLKNGIFYDTPVIDRHKNIYKLKIKDNKLVACNRNNIYTVERKDGFSESLSFSLNSKFNNLEKGSIYIDYVDNIEQIKLHDYYMNYKCGFDSKKINKLINELADTNIYKNELCFTYCDEMIFKIYNNKIGNDELDNYVKTISNRLLDLLKNNETSINSLLIKDIDKIVEIARMRNMKFDYYIAFLYIVSLSYSKYTSIDLKNSYIKDYSKTISIILNRLHNYQEINKSIVSNLESNAKVKII